MHTGRSTVKKTINQPGPLFFFAMTIWGISFVPGSFC